MIETYRDQITALDEQLLATVNARVEPDADLILERLGVSV